MKKKVLDHQDSLDFLNSSIYANSTQYWQNYWLSPLPLVNQFEYRYPDFNDIKTLFKSIRVKNILDIGCGNGAISFELARLNYKVTGIDVSPVAISQACGKFSNDEFDVDFDCGDVLDMPYPYGSFDAGLAFYIFEFLTFDLASYLVNQLKSIIMPGGLLVSSISTIDRDKFLNYEVLPDDTLILKDENQQGMFYHFYTEAKILSLFINWQVKEITRLDNDKYLIVARNFSNN